MKELLLVGLIGLILMSCSTPKPKHTYIFNDPIKSDSLLDLPDRTKMRFSIQNALLY